MVHTAQSKKGFTSETGKSSLHIPNEKKTSLSDGSEIDYDNKRME
jgi:hypothetical protein